MTGRATRRTLAVLALIYGLISGPTAPIAGAAARPEELQSTPGPASTLGPSYSSPRAYPPDPAANIPRAPEVWGSAAEIEAAFNHARSVESGQLGITLPSLSLPNQGAWDAMGDGEKALWLINRERADRGVHPLHGAESHVTEVAQAYAQYLVDHDVFSHTADGRTPWQRLAANPTIGACHESLFVGENLFAMMTNSSSIAFPVEKALYWWMYLDASSSWGHRHTLLWHPYHDDSGPTGMEGFLGLGRASGPFQGWNYAEVIVLNVFDPCAAWRYGFDQKARLHLPLILY